MRLPCLRPDNMLPSRQLLLTWPGNAILSYSAFCKSRYFELDGHAREFVDTLLGPRPGGFFPVRNCQVINYVIRVFRRKHMKCPLLNTPVLRVILTTGWPRLEGPSNNSSLVLLPKTTTFNFHLDSVKASHLTTETLL